MSTSTPFCNTCQRSPPEVILLPCNNCSQTTYCSRPCEDADLATHQDICDQTPSPFSALSSPDQGQNSFFNTKDPQGITHHLPLPLRIRNPHTCLLINKFLHNLPHHDVYTILIDTHRLHLHDQQKYGPDQVSTSRKQLQQQQNYEQQDSLAHFISLASCRIKPNPLLPPWWTSSSLLTLLALASGNLANNTSFLVPNLSKDTKEWLDLTSKPTISKEEIKSHHYHQYTTNNDNNGARSTNEHKKLNNNRTGFDSSLRKGDFILQFRYLAQVIYGRPTTGGISFKPTIALLAEIEKRKR